MQYEEVKELISIFENTDLNDMELTLDNMSIRLNRGRAANTTVSQQGFSSVQNVTAASSVQPAAEAVINSTVSTGEQLESSDAKEGTFVKAPIVGTFYSSSAPDQPSFVKVGDKIEPGDTLCIIEAMKFMNEVPSEVGGTVAEVLAKDGEFVEYGQALFRIQ